jgi:pimeloyl-ACP methyl ester carboxylesterase
MPYAITNDGVQLHYEETGSGTPVVFVHEFAGDFRSWEPQLRHFGQSYRAIAFNARGYPPSGVPADPQAYSQAHAADDILAMLDHLRLESAHIVGLSMGGFATLHFGFRHPARSRSLTVAGCGSGAEPERRESFLAQTTANIAFIRNEGMKAFAERHAHGPTRVQFEAKDPRGFSEFKREFGKHDAVGAVNTMAGVQRDRPSLWHLTEEMRALRVPTLILTGDEDWSCLRPGILMKEMIPSAALVVMPNSGHTINLEDPDGFNRVVGEFFGKVERGRWPERDPRAVGATVIEIGRAG